MSWKTTTKGKFFEFYGLSNGPFLRKYNDYFRDECKWSAEPQSIFEGHMKKMVREALEKKVVWPWIAPNEDEAEKRKQVLKSQGFKEWKNPKAKGNSNKWTLRYAIEAKTGTL